jgi:glyoxylase-like metal-dependent hydrolase (beta-lactamase superfamily II)
LLFHFSEREGLPMIAATILATVLQTGAATTTALPALPVLPPPQQIAADTFLIRGVTQPGRQPDGNTTIVRTPQGLLVVDTGRHVWHSDAILAFANAQNLPIVAIVNSHWHLDHTSGNGRLKAAYPNAQVYATNAIDRALAPGGFINRDAANISTYLASPQLSDLDKDEVRLFADTFAHSGLLRPDVVLRRSQTMRIAGRRLDVHVTNHAVTDADVWLYDRATHTAIVGDLVTMPAPFFETACPREWSQTLNEVWATPFTTAIPGHGAPMTRADFDTYRTAFNAFMDCVRSSREAAQCGAVWADGVAPITPDLRRRHDGIAQNAGYYVATLREHGGKSADCQLAS